MFFIAEEAIYLLDLDQESKKFGLTKISCSSEEKSEREAAIELGTKIKGGIITFFKTETAFFTIQDQVIKIGPVKFMKAAFTTSTSDYRLEKSNGKIILTKIALLPGKQSGVKPGTTKGDEVSISAKKGLALYQKGEPIAETSPIQDL